MSLPDASRLASLSPSTLTALRECFASQGYTDKMLAEGESIAPGLFDALRLPVVHRALERADTPAHDLALLFTYDADVSDARTRRALGETLLAALRDAEVLAEVDGGAAWRARYRVVPFEGLWIVSDDPTAGGDSVMGPGPTTLQLARLMPARCPASALDVGCGAGTFALLAAARGSTRAVGVDINERAVVLSQLNATLNGLDCHFAAGDLYAPVAGERFELIVSQPPFVVRPPSAADTTYLYGGAMGDELAMRMVAETPAALAVGGRALVLMSSAVRPRAPLYARLREALGAAPIDLLILAAQGASPAAQAIGYTSLDHPDFGPAYAAAVRRYCDHLDAMGIREVTHAVVVLSNNGRAARFSATLPMKSMLAADAASLDRALAAVELAGADDDTLLAARVTTPPTATFVEERARPDREAEPVITVKLERGGIGADQKVSEATFALLGALCACATVAEAVDGYAALCEVSPDEVRGEVLTFVRQSLARGLLVRA